MRAWRASCLGGHEPSTPLVFYTHSHCTYNMFLHPDTWFFHYRTILLNDGVEKLIRKAKMTHASCKDAAMAALRDLGLNNYNA
jgi:hypothetical protein